MVLPFGGDVVVHDVHAPDTPKLNLAVDRERWYRSPPDLNLNLNDARGSERMTALTK